MKDRIWYCHCIKATPGQLDREPFYLYQAREAFVEITRWHNPDDATDEWIVRCEGRIIANEEWMGCALGAASYTLMAQSRIKAEKLATWHPEENTPKEACTL